MSIVINVVSPSRSWIMSDGMARNSNNGEIVSSTLQKFELIHPKLCIGYTGSLDFAKETVRNFKNIYPNARSANIEDASIVLYKIMTDLWKQTELRAQFLATGISRSGCLGTIAISNEGHCIALYPDGNDLSSIVLSNHKELDFASYLKKQTGPPILDILVFQAMSEMVQDVAKIDPSVNENMYVQILEA